MGEGLIAGVVSVIAALAGQLRLMSRPDRMRKRILGTLELLDEVEKRSIASGGEKVRSLVLEQTEYLAKLERRVMERRYDPSQPFIGLLFAVPLGYGAYKAWMETGWFWTCVGVVAGLISVLLLWVGIKGFFTAPRTSKPEEQEA